MSKQRKSQCGARVPRSHCGISRRKQAPVWLTGSTLCVLTASFTLPANAGNLPVPCIAAGSCGVTGPANWVTSGAATATQTANQLTVNQTSQNAILNWQSFNIGAGNSVNFVQPNSTALAINNIFQGSPSQIFGSLTANGRVYLINQNGIMFGAGSQVNVGGLVASSLNITQNAILNGIAQTLASGDQTTPSFVPFTDASGAPLMSGNITVAQGASLQSKAGQIFLFAPNVTNQGTISTPDGQTILAAGTSVYLATSNDPSVRGITVAVDGAGTVTNGSDTNATVTDPTKLVGQIVAQRGNVTLMGLAVNQQGLVSANTSVEENGTIMLLAANRTQGGTLTLGANSVTEAGLDLSDTSQAVDATLQQKSAVSLQGTNVNVAGGSSIVATSGSVTITGSTAGVQGSTDAPTHAPSSTSDGSRIYIADGANIDVSGATAILPMSANSLEVQLRGSELADDANQRNGALRGQTVTVDVRQYGTLDGTSWVGTPLANLAADVATIEHGLQQRNETGGTVNLQSSGDVIVGSNAKINVSGGATDYQSGYLNTSVLLGANGQVYSISNASPDVVYKGVASTNIVSLTDLRWGVTTTYTGIYGTGQGQYVPGYVQGANAGALTVNAPHVLLDGQLVANVQVGPYQRNPQVANTTQHFDQLPLPGALNLGSSNVVGAYPDLVLTSIDLAAAPVLESLRNADGTAFDPLTDPWPTSLAATMLNPGLIGTNAAGRVQLYANDSITVPSGVDLELPIGGSFGATASNIDFAGKIAGPGASVALKVEPTVGNQQAGPLGITLAPTAVIDVAGAWVNDNPALVPAPATSPLPLNGGSVTIAARDGNITLSQGAVIDVSGGAHELASGTVTAGTAGSISISTSQPDQLGSQPLAPTSLTLGATLRGYGVTDGGSLSLSASSICVTAGLTCSHLSSDGTSSGTITLTPDFFSTGGFGSYSLTANFGGLELTSGTQLSPVQQNFILAPNTLLPSASTLSGVALVGLLPQIQRQAVDLALTAQYVLPNAGTASAAQFNAAPSLSLDKGSSILLDPQGKISLNSDTRILDDGTIASPDGSVSMTVNASLSEQTFIAGHQLWLGPDAIVDVSGTVQTVTDDLGRTQGSVLPGGSVTLTADRGAVELLPGSFINVSGTSGTLDIQQVQGNGATTYVPTVVASAGGSVSIQAAEAALLSGRMSAVSGSPTTVANGSFSLTLDGNDRYLSSDFPQGTLVGSLYHITPREIEVANTQTPVAIAAGTNLPDSLDGQALVSTSALASAGFDSVKLAAPSLNNSVASLSLTNPGEFVAGEIQFNGNVSLSAGRSLTLDAASFLSNGGTATLSAPYVSIEQSQVITQNTVGATNSGTGTLTVNGAMIDLVGATAFGGFSQVTLDSSGDIRANGVLPTVGNTIVAQIPGSLTVSGELDLIAQQVYPSTLTAYSFTAGAGGSGDINIKQAAGTASSTLLSAGGSLTFNAPDITQDGTLRAPLGSIVMNATNITLASGSTTSTSTDGQTIPFGTTQGGFDWVYPLYGTQGSLVYGTDGISLPTQTIQLSGKSVNIAKGATVDVKGGGDLLATEFIPGPTGTVDVLGSSGSFAIIPTSALQFAPNDPYYSSGSGVFAGETIYLAGGGGIPAGTYAVLPARYALLPGAYYVTPEKGFQDLTPGQHISQTDGSVIVAGYMSYAGTSLDASSRTSGFDVEPGTAVQNLAQYTLTTANNYFTAQATTAGVTAQRLPQDAGYLALSATSQLTLDGTLEATPGKGGLGAAVDISSSAIRVVNGEPAAGSDPGVLDLNANSLNQLGAQSILLGGVRTQTSTGLAINTEASTVEVASGATLKAPELLLAAGESVTVDSGATVGSSGTLPTSEAALSLTGDGALLRVAAAGNPLTTRTGTSGLPNSPGQLVLAPGSIIAATGGSVGVDVTSSADFAGTLQLTGGSLSIAGNQVSLGDAPSGTGGIVLPTAVLNGVSLANLSLASRSSIDFYDGANLSATNLTLTSGALRGFDQSNVQISASGQLTLDGASTASSSAGTGPGTGTLTFNAGTVSLGAGSLDVSGFSDASISSQGLLSLSGAGNLTVEGNLDLEAGLLSAASGASWAVTVKNGAFAYNPISNPAAIKAPAVTPLGAKLAITADSIAFNGAAQLHAGALDLTATGSTGGDITLGSAASIDLSAVNTVFDGKTVSSPAGSLALQSQQGSISAAAGSAINVSAVDNSVADAGSLSAQAANGSITLNGSLLGTNADISIDAQSLGSAPALEAALVSGGFTGDWNLRLRGPGDLVVPTGTANAIVGRSVSLTADQGNIDVEGSITSNSASGGSIALSAGNNVTVNGTLDARPQSSGQKNGQIELATEHGGVFVGSDATIEAYDSSVATQSLADGGLYIRAPQTTLATLLPGSSSPAGLTLAGNLQGLRSVTIEGFKTYTNTTGVLDPTDQSVTQMNTDANNFMTNASALVTALGTAKGPAPQIVAGIEIDSNQSLTLNSSWDLSTWRPGGVAGALTIRSAGDLTFNGSLSDGFTGTTGANAFVLTSTGPSWSYRLIAGADLTSSNAMAVQPKWEYGGSNPVLPGSTYGTGSLIVAGGTPASTVGGVPTETMIRTGTGSIDIAAAGNVTLTNQDSVIYTAGVSDPGYAYKGRGQFGTKGLTYPTEGGDIGISAGGDVGYASGAYSTDLVTNWLWRVGTDALSPITNQPISTAWTVNFAEFEQGVGALGGGNVTVIAGGNVSDLSVSVPTIGRQAASNSFQSDSNLQVLNGGNILIRAGLDVKGGSIYDGAGLAVVIAGDQITTSSAVAGLNPVVLLGDATVTLSARAGATLAGVANPTLLPQGNAQSPASGNNYSYFSTYGEDSAVTLQTTTGEAELVNDTSSNSVLVNTYGANITFGNGSPIANGRPLDPAAALRIYPGTVTVDSLRGTLTVDNSFGLYPEANGSLNLLAQGNVVLGSATGTGSTFEIIQSNADPTLLPTVANPQATFDNVQLQLDSLTDSITAGIITNAPTPVHLTGSTPDSTLSRIVSATGDVSMDFPNQSLVSFAAPAQIVAGRDAVNLTVDFTNLESTDVSALIAGRDIVYPLSRSATGLINVTNPTIDVEGPGTLEVIAGRNISLGTSGGITSQGSLQDPYLSGPGATISLEAGVGSPGGQNYSTFITDYLANSTLYTTDLINYMQPIMGGSPTVAQALAAFEALPTAQQTPLIQTIFFAELLASGNAAAASGATHNNFTRGYDAIEALFPNSVPSLSGNQASPYSGEITLYFSRVYTLDGGDINLLAPGGGVNAGLASEPSAFGVGKAASKLGIVAQSTGNINAYTYGDFEVNESRVFAANGGNITVWSTDGNIDAGRGAKTAISAPPPTITYVNGLPEVVFPAALTGSGIQALATSSGVDPGTVSLFAPNGVVNANDAGIVAGNLTIAATAVLGASNIKVSGVSVGVPVEAGGLGASLAGVSAVGSSASQAATAAVEQNSNRNANVAPVTDAALGWLDVFIEGFGADACKPSDADCLKRQSEGH